MMIFFVNEYDSGSDDIVLLVAERARVMFICLIKSIGIKLCNSTCLLPRAQDASIYVQLIR